MPALTYPPVPTTLAWQGRAAFHHPNNRGEERDLSVAEDRLLEVFQGKVEQIEGSIAAVTLKDSRGQEASATCSAVELQRHGLEEGMGFTIEVRQHGNTAVTVITPVPVRNLSEAEWEQIRRKSEETCRDFPASDDA